MATSSDARAAGHAVVPDGNTEHAAALSAACARLRLCTGAPCPSAIAPKLATRGRRTFRLANQASTRIVLLSSLISISRLACLKVFFSVPRGPTTVTTRWSTLTVTETRAESRHERGEGRGGTNTASGRRKRVSGDLQGWLRGRGGGGGGGGGAGGGGGGGAATAQVATTQEREGPHHCRRP